MEAVIMRSGKGYNLFLIRPKVEVWHKTEDYREEWGYPNDKELKVFKKTFRIDKLRIFMG